MHTYKTVEDSGNVSSKSSNSEISETTIVALIIIAVTVWIIIIVTCPILLFRAKSKNAREIESKKADVINNESNKTTLSGDAAQYTDALQLPSAKDAQGAKNDGMKNNPSTINVEVILNETNDRNIENINGTSLFGANSCSNDIEDLYELKSVEAPSNNKMSSKNSGLRTDAGQLEADAVEKNVAIKYKLSNTHETKGMETVKKSGLLRSYSGSDDHEDLYESNPNANKETGTDENENNREEGL